MHDDCELVTIVDSIIYHTLDIWDELNSSPSTNMAATKQTGGTLRWGTGGDSMPAGPAWMRLGMLGNAWPSWR